MSQPNILEAGAEWRREVCSEFCREYIKFHGKRPTEEQIEAFWEDYLDGDIRIGEE